jgi:hypothetical protein
MLSSNANACNQSVMYYLNTAFDYEIRNHLDLEIMRLRSLDDLSDDDHELLERLNTVREYLEIRRKQLQQ